jgi:hypothetical protein
MYFSKSKAGTQEMNAVPIRDGHQGRETQGQTERFLILFERARFVHNEWRFSEWGKLPVCPPFLPFLKGASPKNGFRN